MCLRCTSAASLYARVCAHVLLPPKMTAMMMLMKMTMTIASWQIGDGCSVSCCANKVLTTPIHMFACTYVCVCADVFMKMLSTKVLQARTRPPLEQSRCPERVAKQGVQLAALFVCVCVCAVTSLGMWHSFLICVPQRSIVVNVVQLAASYPYQNRHFILAVCLRARPSVSLSLVCFNALAGAACKRCL